jgi:hypothetical protein
MLTLARHHSQRIVLAFLLALLVSFVALLPVGISSAKPKKDQPATLIVASRLKDGVTAESYERWVQERDYAFVQTIPAITSYRVYRLDPAGTGDGPDYVERIEVTSVAKYNQDVAMNPNTPQVLGELLTYIDVLTFVEAEAVPHAVKGKGQSGATFVVLSRMKDGADMDAYERWVEKTDYKFAKSLRSVSSYDVFSLTPEGEGTQPDYVAWTEVTSAEQYRQELAASRDAARVQAEMQSFVELLSVAEAKLIQPGYSR